MRGAQQLCRLMMDVIDVTVRRAPIADGKSGARLGGFVSG